MKFRNPLLAEGFSVFFSTKKAVNSYLYFVAFLALILLASWPNKPAAEYIASTNIPLTFNYVTIFLYIHLTILAARYSTTRIAGDKFHPTSDWLDHTSVSRGSIILGRTAFGIFHVLFTHFWIINKPREDGESASALCWVHDHLIVRVESNSHCRW